MPDPPRSPDPSSAYSPPRTADLSGRFIHPQPIDGVGDAINEAFSAIFQRRLEPSQFPIAFNVNNWLRLLSPDIQVPPDGMLNVNTEALEIFDFITTQTTPGQRQDRIVLECLYLGDISRLDAIPSAWRRSLQLCLYFRGHDYIERLRAHYGSMFGYAPSVEHAAHVAGLVASAYREWCARGGGWDPADTSSNHEDGLETASIRSVSTDSSTRPSFQTNPSLDGAVGRPGLPAPPPPVISHEAPRRSLSTDARSRDTQLSSVGNIIPENYTRPREGMEYPLSLPPHVLPTDAQAARLSIDAPSTISSIEMPDIPGEREAARRRGQSIHAAQRWAAQGNAVIDADVSRTAVLADPATHPAATSPPLTGMNRVNATFQRAMGRGVNSLTTAMEALLARSPGDSRRREPTAMRRLWLRATGPPTSRRVHSPAAQPLTPVAPNTPAPTGGRLRLIFADGGVYSVPPAPQGNNNLTDPSFWLQQLRSEIGSQSQSQATGTSGAAGSNAFTTEQLSLLAGMISNIHRGRSGSNGEPESRPRDGHGAAKGPGGGGQ